MREQPKILQLAMESPLIGPYKAKLVNCGPDKMLFSFTAVEGGEAIPVVDGEERTFAVAIPGRLYVNGSDNLMNYCKSKGLVELFSESVEYKVWLRLLRKPILLSDTNQLIMNDTDPKLKAEEMNKMQHYVVLMTPGEHTTSDEIKQRLQNGDSFQAENSSFLSYWSQALKNALTVNDSEKAPLEKNWFALADVGFTGHIFRNVPHIENAAAFTTISEATGVVKELIRPFGGLVAVRDEEGGEEQHAIFHRTNVYKDGIQVGFTDKLDLAVGTEVKLDLVENKIANREGVFIDGFEGKYVATGVYVGEKIIDEYRRINQEAKNKLVFKAPECHHISVEELFQDESGKYFSGMALLHKGKQAQERSIGSFVRFEGKNLYFAGVNLAGVDLAYLVRPGDMIECKLTTINDKQESAQYQVKVGRIGQENITDSIFPECKILWKKLWDRSMGFARAEEIISHKVEPLVSCLPEGYAISRVMSLDPPQQQQKTTQAIVVIDVGKHKGKKVRVNVEVMSVFGISLKDCDLLHCIHPYETMYIDVTGIEDQTEGVYETKMCRLASPFEVEPVGSPAELSVENRMGLIAWMDKHSLNYEKFRKVLENDVPFKNYIPFSKKNYLLNCHLISLDPVTDEGAGVTSGTMLVDSGYMRLSTPKNGKGIINMKGQKIVFQRTEFWVFGYKVDKADLSYFLSKDQRLMAECQEITPEDREKNPTLPVRCNYMATIAWIGSAKPRYGMEPNIRDHNNFLKWLAKRDLDISKFEDLVAGKVEPHSQSDLDSQNFLPGLAGCETGRGGAGTSAASVPEDYQQFVMNDGNLAVLRHGPVMAHLLETCIQARGGSDPSLCDLVQNDMMAEMATHVSEALNLAVKQYWKKKHEKIGKMGNQRGMGGNQRQGWNSGHSSGYNSGHSSGYNSGHNSGYNKRKRKYGGGQNGGGQYGGGQYGGGQNGGGYDVAKMFKYY